MAGFEDWRAVTDPTLLAETMAEQFRLSRNELEKAQAALQPAFALGLEKAMASPAAWNDLARAFSAMVPGDGAMPGFERGRAFTDTVFGSDALTAAIARQASLFAGIAPDTLQKLMPGLALLSMETMVRQVMATLSRQQPAGLATGDFAGATAEMMRRGANAVEALGRPSDAPGAGPASGFAAFAPRHFADAFGDALRQGMAFLPAVPPARGRATPQAPAAPETFNPMQPFAAMFEAFAEGMRGALDEAAAPPVRTGAPAQPSRAPAPPAADPPTSPADAPAPADDGLVADLMRSGQQIHADYAREMARLFERYDGKSEPN